MQVMIIWRRTIYRLHQFHLQWISAVFVCPWSVWDDESQRNLRKLTITFNSKSPNFVAKPIFYSSSRKTDQKLR